MPDYIHYFKAREILETQNHDFQMRDEKGRFIGYRITVSKMTTSTEKGIDNGASSGFYRRFSWKDKNHYEILGRVLRNGATFGATPKPIRTLDLEKGMKEIAKRMESAKLRYSKIHKQVAVQA